MKYQIFIPHEVNRLSDEKQSGNQTRVIQSDLEADPATHAAADKN